MLGHLRNVALLLRALRSSRHKNCRINNNNNNCKIQFQTVFYQGFSKQNITSVQAPILGKKILLVDKCDNHVLYCIASQIWHLLQHGIGCRQGQWKGKNFGISFSEEAAKKILHVLQCIFRCDFIFPRTTKVSGIKKYPSASMSCCSDDLAQLLPCLDL